MRKVRLMIAMLMAVLTFVSIPAALSKGWEPTRTNKEILKHVASDSELEIRAGGGIIHVTCNRPVNIKIFTILGSRIADDNLSAGSYQFTVPTHGVYLIKAGDITCKVAV